MKNKTEYEELLKVIINDLKVCISYTKNQDNDLLCFMEQYLKAEKEKRPELLLEIRNCMDGKEYKNPFLAYQNYNQKDIEKLEAILRSYIKDMHVIIPKDDVLINTVDSINKLHEKSFGRLIDGWRNERLIEFLVLVAKDVSFNSAFDLINENKLW